MHFRRPHFILLSAFLASVCNGLVLTIVPLMAKERLGVSAGWLGFYGTIWAVPYIFTAWVAGPLSDRWGRRRCLFWALTVMMAGYVLVPFCIQKHLLLLPLILIGAAHGTFWPAIEAAMSDGQKPSQIKRAAGFFNFCWMGGLIAGPTIGGYLYPVSHNAPVFIAVGIMAILLALLAYPPSLQIAPWGKAISFENDEKVSREKRALFVRLAFIGNITTFFMVASYRSLLAEYAVPRGIAGFDYGLLLAAVTLGMVATNFFLIRWHRWHYSLPFLFFAEGFVVAALLLFCWIDSYPMLLILAASIGFPAGVTYFSSIYYGLEQSEQKGSHSGKHEAIIGIGASIGPILGGLAIGWSGIARGNMVLSAGVFACVILLQAALVRRSLAITGSAPAKTPSLHVDIVSVASNDGSDLP